MRKKPSLLLLFTMMLTVTTCGPTPPEPTPPEAGGVGAALASVDASGAYRTSVSVDVPPNRGLEPALSLVYNSQSGNGLLGVGWGLAGLSVIRRASPGKGMPHYDSRDIFLLDGMELIPCTLTMASPSCKYPASSDYQAYTTRIESFNRIAFDPAQMRWYIWNKIGVKMTFWPRAYAPSFGPYAWDLASIEDTMGNKVVYQHWQDEEVMPHIPETYLDSINYNGSIIKFYYERRPDPLTYGIGYDQVSVRYRLRSIGVSVGGARARVITLKYTLRDATAQSFLTEIRQYGRDAQVNQAGEVTNAQSIQSLPPVIFEAKTGIGDVWTASDLSDPAWGLPQEGGPLLPVYNGLAFAKPFGGDPGIELRASHTEAHLGDFDGDGQTDWVLISPALYPTGPREVTFIATLAAKAPPKYIRQTLPWVGVASLVFGVKTADVNGDGRADILFVMGQEIPGSRNANPPGDLSLYLLAALSQGDGTFAWATYSSQATSWVWESRNGDLRTGYCETGDVNGDSRQDLLCNYTRRDGTHHIGTALSLGNGTFDTTDTPAPFVASIHSHPMTVGDTNGDGLSDAMILDYTPCAPSTPNCTERIELLTALSQGDGSFQFVRQPTTWEWGDTRLFAADINGDGKSDYVMFKSLPSTPAAPNGAILSAMSLPKGNYLLAEQPFPASLAVGEAIVSAGDANGDGKTDLLVANRQRPRQSNCAAGIDYVHLNLHRILSNGDGTFRMPPSWQDCSGSRELDIPWDNPRYTPVEPRAADVNGDGTADFVIMVADLNNTYVTLREDLSSHPIGDTYDWEPAEFNGDGKTDWVYFRSTPTGPLIMALVSNDKTYTPVAQSPKPGTERFTSLRNWKVMDVNGDGRDDLVYVLCVSVTYCQVSTWFYDGTDISSPFRFWSQKDYSGPTPTERNTPNWRPMDINGDGRADLVNVEQEGGKLTVRAQISTGDGTWFEKTDSPIQFWTATDLLNWHSADVNGDGKADLVHVAYLKPGVRVQTLLSKGDGTWENTCSSSCTAWTNTPTGLLLFDTQQWKFVDVNADGATDLVHLSPSDRKPGQPTGLRIHVLLSNGDGSWTPQDQAAGGTFTGDMLQWQPADVNGDHRGELAHVFVELPSAIVTTLGQNIDGTWDLSRDAIVTTEATRDSSGVFFKLGDVDGNGQGDFTRFDLLPSGMRLFSLRPDYPSDLLTRLTNSLGGITEISYRRWFLAGTDDKSMSCQLPVGVGIYSPDEIRVSDGRQVSRGRNFFAYNCPHWSYKERGFLGWEEVIEQHPDSLNHDESSTISRFSITDECLVLPTSTTNITNIATGRSAWKATVLTYDQFGPTAPYHCVVSKEERQQVGLSGMIQSVQTRYVYDEFGNVVDVFEYGADGPNNNDDRHTNITFIPAVGPYIVGLPYRVTIMEGTQPQGKIFRDLYYCYDGDNGTERQSCLGTITKGLLTAQKVGYYLYWPDPITHKVGYYLIGYDTTILGYDSYGNLASLTDANHHTSTYSYDPIFRLFPVASCNALNQCASREWDPVIGHATVMTDTNGLRTEFRYDGFGRLMLTTMPDGGTIRHDYLDWGDPSHQRLRQQVDDGSADGLWTETYLDGLGRPYLAVAKGDVAGRTYAQEAIYADATLLIFQQSHWYATGSKPEYEGYRYDGFGRPTEQIHPDGSFSSFAYDNDLTRTRVAACDELNHPRTIFLDAYGRVAQVQETNNDRLADTIYQYNPVDELLNTIDAAGNVITYTWNTRGDNLAINDPDRGNWVYGYDPNGNLTIEVDAKGNWTELTYDELDRIKTMQYPSGREVRWFYDEAGHGASQGHLTSIVDSSETRCPSMPGVGPVTLDLHYDALGRLDRQKQCIEGLTYEMAFSYDDVGRLNSITYPDGEVVTYAYDATWRMESVSGYVDKFQYDSAGRLVSARLANGVQEDFAYDPQREWLKDAVVTEGNTKLYQAHYDYYSNGLHKSSTSTTNAMNLAYTYDQLNRLTDVTGDIDQHFQYDAIGNMTSNSELGTYSYQYTGSRSGTGCGTQKPMNPCPHAVKQIGTAEFTYDDNGNLSMVKNAVPGSIKPLSIQWNRDNEPYIFADETGVQTNVRYDASGQRVFWSRANDVNLYFGNYLEISYSTTGGPINATQYYYAGPLPIARKDATGKYWYHQDHLGSTRLMTDGSGKVAARYDYKPFGDTVNKTSTLSNDIQFTGQRANTDSGLVYMGARYYDSQIGRFISPDPIIPGVTNPQALNRYSYVYNNPLSFVDPSGYQPEYPGNEIQKEYEPNAVSSGIMEFYSSLVSWRDQLYVDAVAHRSVQLARFLNSTPGGDKIADFLVPRLVAGAQLVNGFSDASDQLGTDFAGVMALSFTDPLIPVKSLASGIAQAYETDGLAGVINRVFPLQDAFDYTDLMERTFEDEDYYAAGYYEFQAFNAWFQVFMALYGMAELGAGEGLSARTAGSIRTVNPTRWTKNCVNCAITTDLRLQGVQASALPSGAKPLSVIENLFGKRFRPASIASIEAELKNAGPGSRGIVFGYRGPTQPGHVFNVVNQKGIIRFLDGQIGGQATLGGYIRFYILRTK